MYTLNTFGHGPLLLQFAKHILRREEALAVESLLSIPGETVIRYISAQGQNLSLVFPYLTGCSQFPRTDIVLGPGKSTLNCRLASLCMGLCRFHVSLGEGRVQPEGICITKNSHSLMLVAGFQGFRFLDVLLQGVWDCVFTGLGLQGSIQLRDSCLGVGGLG